MILSTEIQNTFYSDTGVVLEKTVEETFCNLFKTVKPDITISKKRIGKGTPDGFIVFQDNSKKKIWIPQEVKRDIGASPETLAQMFLQDMMTAGNFLYNLNPFYGRFNFGGLILTSAQFIAFIPKEEVDKIIDEFESLWLKYMYTAPSDAFNISELAIWARKAIKKLKFKVNYLLEDVRLDLIIDSIFNAY